MEKPQSVTRDSVSKHAFQFFFVRMSWKNNKTKCYFLWVNFSFWSIQSLSRKSTSKRKYYVRSVYVNGMCVYVSIAMGWPKFKAINTHSRFVCCVRNYQPKGDVITNYHMEKFKWTVNKTAHLRSNHTPNRVYFIGRWFDFILMFMNAIVIDCLLNPLSGQTPFFQLFWKHFLGNLRSILFPFQ